MRVGTYTNRTPDASDPKNYAVVREDLCIAGRRAAPADRLGSDVTDGVKLMPYGEDIAVPPVANDRTKLLLTIGMTVAWIMRTSGIIRRVRVGF